MEPILSKEEIADLLAAIRAGKVSTDFVENGQYRPRHIIHATDIDLFRTYERTRGSGEMRIPNLDIVIDNFARKFSTSLTNSLQRNLTVEREEITSTDFQQSLKNLNGQGAVGIYSIAPLKYGCLFHFDTLLAFTLLEIMLGSSLSSESLALDRNLTTIEISILKNTMTEICNELQNAFRPIIDLQAHLTKVENNFRLVSIVEPETEVLVTRFNLRLAGEICGQMQWVIPYLTLEPLREKFKALVTFTQAASPNWSRVFARETLEMESTVIARSGLINMSIRKILNLQPGDIIDLHYNPDQPLTVMVEDQPLFLAIPGERNGKKAFHVTGRHSNRLGGIHGST
ncbi:MAG: flagellar motor switch protein FliM [Desulfobulbaceae bacterium]|nr:flagellar motor switch protein FliM [Desulfobulbaceae bacterium]